MNTGTLRSTYSTFLHQFLFLPIFLRFTSVASFVGLVIALGSFFVPSYPAALLCIYFFFLWIFWNVCAWIDVPLKKFVRIIYLWLLIDFSILVSFISVANSLGDVTNSQGSDLVWGAAYLPSILPFGVIVSIIPYSFELLSKAITTIFINTIGAAFGHVFATWVLMSLISIIQCCMVCTLIQFVPRRKANSTQ